MPIGFLHLVGLPKQFQSRSNPIFDSTVLEFTSECKGVAVITKPLRANQRGVEASQRGPVEWGEFLSVRLSVYPSLPPSAYSKGSDSQCRGFEGKLEGSKGQLEGSESHLEGSEGQLEGYGGQPEGSESQPEECDGQPAGFEGQPAGFAG